MGTYLVCYEMITKGQAQWSKKPLLSFWRISSCYFLIISLFWIFLINIPPCYKMKSNGSFGCYRLITSSKIKKVSKFQNT